MQLVPEMNPYRLLPVFFDPGTSERWQNADDRAHKTFVVLEWLELLKEPAPLVMRAGSMRTD
jgi:hypothetical protein